MRKKEKTTTETTKKIKVAITATDGKVIEYSGDTAIVFTVEDVNEFLRGKTERIHANSAFVGNNISDLVFADTIASLVITLIKNKYRKTPTIASFNLMDISETMQKVAEKMGSELTLEQMASDMHSVVDDILN